MDPLSIIEQVLNGLQFGVMLFLMAAGLSLVFGILNVVNLAHGSFYMIGAYVCAYVFGVTGSYILAVIAALIVTGGVGLVVEATVFREIYKRDHVDQVLATFALTLIFNEVVRLIWGDTGLYASVPPFLAGSVQLLPGFRYPVYRLAIIVVGLAIAAFVYIFVTRTRLGMLVRAAASNRTMAGVLGVNIVVLYAVVFVLGTVLAALSGLMAGPIFTVASGMGDSIVILAFVIIVIGGIGSIRGAFVAALLVGMADTLGRAFLGPTLESFLPVSAADMMGPALASMLIYIIMAGVLVFRPQGLFPPKVR